MCLKDSFSRRLLNAVAILMMLGVLGVVALVASLWVERRTEVTLPTPTGPLPIGRTSFVWGDDRPDNLAPVQAAKRELVVWVWYPAAVGPSDATDDYWPAPWRAESERNRSALFALVTRDPSHVRVHSVRNAAVSAQERSYPVLIMRAGASAGVTNYTTLAEDLASHGYIVVGFDAPYRTSVVVFPDGRVMQRTPENDPELGAGQARLDRVNRLLAAWTADVAFVVDRLEGLNSGNGGDAAALMLRGRLDMTRVGVFGHSFGGAQAAQFCHDDSRCKAGIDVDGIPFGSVVQEGLHQPFMFLLSEHIHATDPESRAIQADIQSIYDHLPPDARWRIAIRGANHFLFSDDGAVLKSEIVRRTLRTVGVLGIDGRRQLAVTTYCVRSFFDAYLKGAGASRFAISSPLYPEIEVLE